MWLFIDLDVEMIDHTPPHTDRWSFHIISPHLAAELHLSVHGDNFDFESLGLLLL